MKKLVRLIASTILSLYPAEAASDTSPFKTKEIADIPFFLSQEKIVYFYKDNYVDVTVSVKAGMRLESLYFSKYIIESGIKDSWNNMERYLDANRISKEPCRNNQYNLNIFIVDLDLLQDRNRFKDIYSTPIIAGEGGYAMYAYYDPTPYLDNNSTIIISDVTDYLNQKDIIHEVSHYWWDRLCLGSKIRGYDTESFARKMEDIYSTYQ